MQSLAAAAGDAEEAKPAIQTGAFASEAAAWELALRASVQGDSCVRMAEQ